MACRSLYSDVGMDVMKRTLAVLFALTFLGAAPANRPQFVFDNRIPAENQQLLEQALTEALGAGGRHAKVVVELRVVEAEPRQGMLLAP